MLCVILITLALSHGDSIRKANFFGPITQNLQNLSDVGTFAFGAAGMEDLPLQAIAGALLGSGQTFRKYRTVMEIFKKACWNAKG